MDGNTINICPDLGPPFHHKLIPTAVPTAVQIKAWLDTDEPPMSWLHIKTSLMGAIWREVIESFSSK
jgi:hypothetical protein